MILIPPSQHLHPLNEGPHTHTHTYTHTYTHRGCTEKYKQLYTHLATSFLKNTCIYWNEIFSHIMAHVGMYIFTKYINIHLYAHIQVLICICTYIQAWRYSHKYVYIYIYIYYIQGEVDIYWQVSPVILAKTQIDWNEILTHIFTYSFSHSCTCVCVYLCTTKVSGLKIIVNALNSNSRDVLKSFAPLPSTHG